MGHSMRDSVYKGLHLGRRRTAGTASARDTDNRTMRPTTADTLVAKDGPWVSDASHYPAEGGVSAASQPDLAMGDNGEPTLGERMISSSSRRLPHSPSQQEISLDGNHRPRTITQTSPPDTAVNLNFDTDHPVQIYDDYDSDVGNNNANNEIMEVPRGREGSQPALRRTMSGPSLVSSPELGIGGRSETPRGPSPPAISSRSPILPPIFPSPNIPHSYSPQSQLYRTRPRTAPATPTSMITATTTIAGYSPSPLASVSTSIPGAGDSTGSIRHHRLDFIRASDTTTTAPAHGHRPGYRTPPTRDSSPSRSVRFADDVDGESGHVGVE